MKFSERILHRYLVYTKDLAKDQYVLMINGRLGYMEQLQNPAAVMVVALFTAALAGSALGFLRYNFNPARIFMGDTGSMFLGFILAGISVIGAVKCAATIALIVPILALGVPIMDTTFAIIRRYRGGVPIFKPDKGHLHHRLLDLGFSQKQAVLLMYVISALLGLSAVVLNEVSGSMSIVIVVCVLLVVFLGAKKLGIFRLKTK